MKSGTLYVIQERCTPQNKKIGVTKNRAEDRRKQLQTGNPRDLEVQYEFRAIDRYKSESDLHRALSRDLITTGGEEWFGLDTDDKLNHLLNQMIERREVSPVSTYDGNVDYVKMVMYEIDGWPLRISAAIIVVALILYLIWNGAFL